MNLQPLIAYEITKGSSDHTFSVGDIIWMSENGDINNVKAGGWITPSECPKKTLDFECAKSEKYEVLKIDGHEICRQTDLILER